MAELFYREDRDMDFLNACETIRQESEKHLSVTQIASIAIFKPAKSFYIHPREYSNIVRRGKNNLPKNKVSRELHIEVLSRYESLRDKHSELKDEDLYKMLSEQSAPRFYISKSRGIILYYELLKR